MGAGSRRTRWSPLPGVPWGAAKREQVSRFRIGVRPELTEGQGVG